MAAPTAAPAPVSSPAPSTGTVGASVPFSAASVYGGAPAAQPLTTGQPDHTPGTPEPMARTLPRSSAQGMRANPLFALAVLVAVAVLLAQLAR